MKDIMYVLSPENVSEIEQTSIISKAKIILPRQEVPVIYDNNEDKVLGLCKIFEKDNSYYFQFKLNDKRIKQYRLLASSLYIKPLLKIIDNKWQYIDKLSLNKSKCNITLTSINLPEKIQ